MGRRKYNFQRDLKRGKDGEDMLVELWPDMFVPPPEKVRAYDLLHVDGRTVELKSDYHCHETTPNFFIEMDSHGKPGGPWRSLRDKVDIFVYLFVEPEPIAYVWDNIPKLCKVLDKKFVPNAPGRRIDNGKWFASGLLVDREMLVSKTKVEILTL